MQRFGALLVLLLVAGALLASRSAPGERAGEDGPTRLVAQCLFADPRVELGAVPRYRMRAVLDAHARGHGWAAGGAADLVAPAACPPQALDHLMRGHFDDGRHLETIAVALERNGRAEHAFELVRDAIEHASGGDGGPVESEASRLAAFGARLAARAGRHADVLAFAESWRPLHWCGTCEAGLSGEKIAVVAPALAALGREDELVALAVPHDLPYDAGLAAVIALVGLESSRHDALDLEDVVEEYLVPRYGEKIGAERLRFAGRALANQRVVVVIDAHDAEERAASARGAVERWLVALGTEGRSVLVAATIGSGTRSSRVMDVLVSLGAPEATAWVEAVAPDRRRAFDVANHLWRVLAGEVQAYDLLLDPP